MNEVLTKFLLLVLATVVQSKLDYNCSSEAANVTTAALECPVRNMGEVAYCSDNNRSVYIQACYCMTFGEGHTYVGNCLLTCFYDAKYCVPWNNDTNEFNDIMCSGKPVGMDFNRKDRLCGRCKKGYGFPAYSYSYINCVECDGFSFQNLLRYIAMAYGPLTLFFLFVVVFRFSVTSGPLNAYVLLCQSLTLSINTRIMAAANPDRNGVFPLYTTLLGVWNLDFFRAYYKPFCLLPQHRPTPTIALDYLVAVYPLFLVLLTYFLVVLHDRNYRIVTALWRPFFRCFIAIRKEWNIRSSLIDAFTTFFLLSYMKILNVSFDLLMFTYMRDENGHHLARHFLLNDPSTTFSSTAGYTMLALAAISVFILLPMALLCLYPCRCFQKCLNRCGFRCLPLHAFMDVLTGCYRHTPRDCRYFAGVYLLMRIMVLVLFQMTLTIYYIPALAMFLLIAAIVFAIAQPYKNPMYNVLDVVVLLAVALFINTVMAFYLAKYTATVSVGAAFISGTIVGALVLLYPTGLTLMWLWKFLQVIFNKIIQARERAAARDVGGEREPLMPHV